MIESVRGQVAEKLGPKREKVRGGLENRKICSPPQTLME